MMIVKPAEFISARDASRALGRLIDRLEAGELAKAVIVDRNRPRVVVLTVEEYEALAASPSRLHLQRMSIPDRRHVDILRGRVEELTRENNKLWSALGRLSDRLAQAGEKWDR